jgi:Putative ABC exporter
VSAQHPALRTLARLKRRAAWRRLRRRLRTPSGLLFGLLGLLVTGGWIGSVVWRARLGGTAGAHGPEVAQAIARAMMLVFGVVVIASSFGHRGLYLPPDELERLLAAPLRRAQLVRYRLVGTVLRSSVFSLLMAALIAPRMPNRVFGFLGVWLAMSTLPILGQGAAILMGDAENRIGRLAGRVPRTLMRVLTGLGLWGLIMLMIGGEDLFGAIQLPEIDLGQGTARPQAFPEQLAQHPLVLWLSVPGIPWARAAAAGSLPVFAGWLLVAGLLSAFLFEAVVRLPVDFRELSLATSADVSKRLSRMRSGRGAVAGMGVSDHARGLRVPWLMGRGPSGAVAWLQLVAMRRKARGALLFALFTTGFALLLSTVALDDPLAGAVFLAVFGVVYLASGLRFDFRGNLDLMETLRAWPVPAWRVFLATLLPETLVVGLLMASAQVVRLAVLGVWPVEVGLVVLATPFATLLWLALDNFVFLLVPVRFEPGQASAMHFAGRTLVLALLKLALVGVLALLVGLAVALCLSVASGLGAPLWVGVGLGILTGVTTTVGAIAAAVAAGGWALARFDVAKVKARLG